MRLVIRPTCRHEYEFVRNIYGDEINHVGGMRSLWRCVKCGRRALGTSLQNDDDRGPKGKERK